MVCADRDIVIFNKYLDKATRRTLYRPTLIKGCSVYDQTQTSKNGGFHSGALEFRIRIPKDAQTQDGRLYVDAASYDMVLDSAGFWTIHTEDYIVVKTAGRVTSVDGSATEQEIVDYAKQHGYQGRALMVSEYSDNTHRGSSGMRHWRIIGV